MAQIFSGKRFFVAQRVPSRSRFLGDIEGNGGLIVRIEQQADFVIVDHLRKDAPPGSLSYTFIESALKDGTLPLEENHQAGVAQGTVREVGSRLVPGKNTRTPFTAEDDRVLYQWVHDCQMRGGSVKGNEIYKDLAAKVRE